MLWHQLTPAYERAQAAFKEAEAAYSAARREQDQLYAKQGNGKRFNSKRERDAALRKEIKSVQRSISKLEGTRKTALRVVETTEAKVESDKQRITALTKQRAGLLARTKKDAQRVARLSAAREEAIAERVAAHKQQDDVDREVRALSLVPSAVRVVQRHGITCGWVSVTVRESQEKDPGV